MLDTLYANTQKHFLLSCFSFLVACALIGMAVVGSGNLFQVALIHNCVTSVNNILGTKSI